MSVSIGNNTAVNEIIIEPTHAEGTSGASQVDVRARYLNLFTSKGWYGEVTRSRRLNISCNRFNGPVGWGWYWLKTDWKENAFSAALNIRPEIIGKFCEYHVCYLSCFPAVWSSIRNQTNLRCWFQKVQSKCKFDCILSKCTPCSQQVGSRIPCL